MVIFLPYQHGLFELFLPSHPHYDLGAVSFEGPYHEMEIIAIVEKFDLCLNNVILCMHTVELDFIIDLIKGVIKQLFDNIFQTSILHFFCVF